MPNMNYHCPWCHYEFQQFVRFVKGIEEMNNPASKGKKGSVSDQVKCPKCMNFLQTWPRIDIGGRTIRKGRGFG